MADRGVSCIWIALFSVMVSSVHSSAGEPRCHSMYDYDRKMLRDMYAMELELSSLKDELRVLKESVGKQTKLAEAGKIFYRHT